MPQKCWKPSPQKLIRNTFSSLQPWASQTAQTDKNSYSEGSCLMLLLGPGKNSHLPKIALAKFLFYVSSNKINSHENRISQILVIVLKNRSNEIRIRREPSVQYYMIHFLCKPRFCPSRLGPCLAFRWISFFNHHHASNCPRRGTFWAHPTN